MRRAISLSGSAHGKFLCASQQDGDYISGAQVLNDLFYGKIGIGKGVALFDISQVNHLDFPRHLIELMELSPDFFRSQRGSFVKRLSVFRNS